jgi:hypothetical protein
MVARPIPVSLRSVDWDAELENLFAHLRQHRKAFFVEAEFDTYEKVGDNYIWRVESVGIKRALRELKELCAGSRNEFVLMHTPSGTVITRINSTQSPSLQIAGARVDFAVAFGYAKD